MATFYQNNKEKRSIFLLGLTSFFNDASSEMIKPILPMFIAALGGNNLIIGLLGGTRELVARLFTVFFGYWSDRIGRRRIFVYLGYFVPALSKFFLGLSQTWRAAFAFASVERIGKGVRSASRDAILVELSPYKKGFSFGLHRTFDTGGGIAGTLLALALVWLFQLNFMQLIVIASLIGTLSIIPLIGIPATSRDKTKQPLSAALKKLAPKLKRFVAIAGLFASANFSYMFFLIKAQMLFPNHRSPTLPIILYLIFNVTYAATALPLGSLSDKIGRKKVITAGYLLFSGICLCFTQVQTLHAFFVLFALYGLVYAMVESNQRAFVADLTGEHEKATALGALYTAMGMLSFVGNAIAGSLLEFVSSYVMFLFASIISMIAALLLIMFCSHE